MKSITITLPLPNPGLTPNRRANGGQYMVLKKAARGNGYLCAFAALNRRDAPKWDKASVEVKRYGKTSKRPDDENLIASFKHYIDGIEDCGIIKNDKGLNWITPITYGVDKQNPRVELTFTEKDQP